MEIIKEQWDNLVRVAAALKNRIVPAHVIVQRLSTSADCLRKHLLNWVN